MIDWLADPDRNAQVSAWGFLIGSIGLLPTLVGLYLTYRQAKNARLSAQQVADEVRKFGLHRDKSESLGWLGEARASIEVAAVLISAQKWREASSVYDEARKSLQKVRTSCGALPPVHKKKLRLIVEHLTAFSDDVDDALEGKGSYPDGSSVRATIRRHTDDLTLIQREIHEGMI